MHQTINIVFPMLQPKYLFTSRAIISTPPVVPPKRKIIPSPIPIATPANKAQVSNRHLKGISI